MSSFHLAVPNTQQSIPVAEAFIHRVAASAALHPHEVALASKAAALAVEYAVLFGYPEGRADQISLDAWLESSMLHVTVHDNGVPEVPGSDLDDEDQVQFEARLDEALEALNAHEWRLLGYGGKELTFTIQAVGTEADIRPSIKRKAAEPVDAEQYVIRRLIPKDAPQVSRLVYRTYGHTYDDEDYYYPDKIVAENETGAMVSIVAVHPGGEVVGHYALEQREPPDLYEGSSAVVNPDHRGKGLMERMKAFGLEEGRRLALKGVYFLPWTIHTISQKANEHFGSKLCAINLSDTSPVAIKGFEEESLAQRVSTVLYFTPLLELEPRSIFVPKRHQGMISKIYENLGLPFHFEEPTIESEGLTSISVSHLPHDQFAEIRVRHIGIDFGETLRHELREASLHQGCETVYLNLPLASPATPQAVEQAEKLGFSFLGIGPYFADDGDMLRMAYMSTPLDPSHIHVLSPFGQELLAYSLAEQTRVQG
ncbi:MAG: GNAT family N-acetyltransferase [Fimbriimonas sp.]